MSKDNRLIQGYLGRDAKHYNNEVPKTIMSVATKIDKETKWVDVTMYGKLATDFKDYKKGSGITLEGDLLPPDQGKNSDFKLTAENALKHQKRDKEKPIEAVVAQKPTINPEANRPNNVFAIANSGGKAIPINITAWNNKEQVANLKVGDKIQLTGTAVVIPTKPKNPEQAQQTDQQPAGNSKETQATQDQGQDNGKTTKAKKDNFVDFKYQMTNPTITPVLEKAQSKETEAKKPGTETEAVKEPKQPSAQTKQTPTKGEFVAGTQNFTLFKVDKTYEVIATGEGLGNKVVDTQTNKTAATKSLRSSEKAHQLQSGVENPKVKVEKDKKRDYPKDVNRSAVKDTSVKKKEPAMAV